MEQSIRERSGRPACSASVRGLPSERGEAVPATKEPNHGGAYILCLLRTIFIFSHVLFSCVVRCPAYSISYNPLRDKVNKWYDIVAGLHIIDLSSFCTPAVQTDFSVTSRLLHHVSPHSYNSQPAGTSKSPSDWQYHLPNDQGVVSSRYFWQSGVPNASLPATNPKRTSSNSQPQRPSSNGHSSSSSHAAPGDTSNLYTLYHAAMVHGPMSTDPQKTQLKPEVPYPHLPSYYPPPASHAPSVTGSSTGPNTPSGNAAAAVAQIDTSPLDNNHEISQGGSLLIITPNSVDPSTTFHGQQKGMSNIYCYNYT